MQESLRVGWPLAQRRPIDIGAHVFGANIHARLAGQALKRWHTPDWDSPFGDPDRHGLWADLEVAGDFGRAAEQGDEWFKVHKSHITPAINNLTARTVVCDIGATLCKWSLL